MRDDPTGMACQDLVEVVTVYLEDALPADLRARFDRHLQICDACRSYVEQIRLTIRLSGHVESGTLSPNTRETLLAAFRNWRDVAETQPDKPL
jgi:anti-sigma factor RsiW